MAKILLIDDDALVRETLKGFLEMGGHEVTLTAHGLQALAAVSRIEFQLVLTDILMPEMEGIEIIRRLRELRPSMPIVAMSSSMATRVRKGVRVSADYLDMALRLGAMKIIRKPFTPGQLLEAVNGCLLSRTQNSLRVVEGGDLKQGRHSVTTLLPEADLCPYTECVGELFAKETDRVQEVYDRIVPGKA